MTKITKDDVKHVAKLARLEFSEEELERYTDQLSSILNFSEQLNELDTTDVEPTTHVLDMKNVMRKDEAKEWIKKEDALNNAPDQLDGQFRVPSILD
ncbi:Asp-tRNA(Asn)/Glu-tRNA(Gln) amidotransferase subunit GatC [Halalkalibacillus halophilus]|uniref:Asp-tRNA(Asn)/Glu-tRNA(Gln) amidotransferase subunit GatC n=1 Tax=Halalkalibacillus halophilus TaxID=392827 RepID=UPI0003FFC9A4|nr:Asp-tRNA(Asn)/Glu-tRNA(Gln) amidotransferase subunit GatC [Halalkalibacillus halophilus]